MLELSILKRHGIDDKLIELVVTIYFYSRLINEIIIQGPKLDEILKLPEEDQDEAIKRHVDELLNEEKLKNKDY